LKVNQAARFSLDGNPLEPAQLQTEDDQDGEQSLDALVTEPQARGSLTIDLGRTDYPIEGADAIQVTTETQRAAGAAVYLLAGAFPENGFHPGAQLAQ
jgi:hypothetical protein